MTDREVMKMALYALMDANKFEYKDEIEALRQALAQPEQEPVATEKIGSPCPEFWDWLPKAYNFEGNGAFTKYNMEVAFLAGKNMALAQPEQKLIGWKDGEPQYVTQPKPAVRGGPALYTDIVSDGGFDPRNKFDAQPEQEPVAWMLPDYGDVLSASEADGTGIYNIPLYTAPPKRQWQGLTDDEVDECNKLGLRDDVYKAIEAALRNKNT